MNKIKFLTLWDYLLAYFTLPLEKQWNSPRKKRKNLRWYAKVVRILSQTIRGLDVRCFKETVGRTKKETTSILSWVLHVFLFVKKSVFQALIYLIKSMENESLKWTPFYCLAWQSQIKRKGITVDIGGSLVGH